MSEHERLRETETEWRERLTDPDPIRAYDDHAPGPDGTETATFALGWF